MNKNFFLLLLLLMVTIKSNCCTNFLVTKSASYDGSTMITYSADSHIRYGELYWLPAQDWDSGSFVTLYDRGTAKPLGKIPQVAHTYQVIGFMNEHQVSIGETTFGGRDELIDTTAIIDYGSLMFLALQRSKTAREAIKTIAELVEKYGYASSGESFSIADPNEVWIMEIIGKGIDYGIDSKTNKQYNKNKGAIWIAIKIPEGYVSAHANQARITTFELENLKTSITNRNFSKLNNRELETIYSEDIIDFARKKGYFKGKNNDFSFSDTYAPIDFEALRFCEIRVWAFFNEISDEMKDYYDYAKGDVSKKRMPLFVKPKMKLTPQNLMHFKRNHLENTELDMANDVGAGAFELPYRWRPLTWEYNNKKYFNERATATQQTGFSFVAQMRNWLPNYIGGIFWFSVDDAGQTVFVPFYTGITKVPHCFAENNGDMLNYSETSAFWIFNRVSHFAYLFYNRVIDDIREKQDFLEKLFVNETIKADSISILLSKESISKAKDYLTNFSDSAANLTFNTWKELDKFLLVKYLDGNVKHEKNGKFIENGYGYPKNPMFPGYSNSWKSNVVNETKDKLILK